MKTNKKYNEIMEWSGALLILLGFFLNSFGVIQTDDLLYPIINMIGAFLLSLITFKKKAFATSFLNLSWLVIAIISIVKIFL